MRFYLYKFGAGILVAIAIAAGILAYWQAWQFRLGQMSRDQLVFGLGCTGVAIIAAYLSFRFAKSDRGSFKVDAPIDRLPGIVILGLMAMGGLAGSLVFEMRTGGVAADRLVGPATTAAGLRLWELRMDSAFVTATAILVMAAFLGIGLLFVIFVLITERTRGVQTKVHPADRDWDAVGLLTNAA